jgi:hypothetical protein
MEQFTGNIPTGWATSTPNVVKRDTEPGNVHSGNTAVALSNGATLFQTVPVSGGCFYELTFFVHGEGAQVGFTATVTFAPAEGSGEGLKIVVRQQDLPNANREFGFFKGITVRAPAEASLAEIRFEVVANGNQYMDLDDVSFAAR